jgi:hypothetical protein
MATLVHESFWPSYRVTMSTKHIRTVADLVRFGAGLKIDCGDCFASRTFGGYEIAKLGGVGTLGDLQRRFKCSRCGRKNARVMILPPLPPRG